MYKIIKRHTLVNYLFAILAGIIASIGNANLLNASAIVDRLDTKTISHGIPRSIFATCLSLTTSLRANLKTPVAPLSNTRKAFYNFIRAANIIEPSKAVPTIKEEQARHLREITTYVDDGVSFFSDDTCTP